ncbi:hypothetical protein O7598_31085 [Micromonospora sp. WMMC241]|uniref:hypothetical protein n=1 Tax=Micromonospora sp. WMMC241 TaxID=3015159 RepID=UPI0022B70354|nr:hypothetical protein [Micromonospora sp. WMMC241]MCZ7440803.1 hypothetical protein [Micromonospora sp. WMMC241]MCZ7440870.1 hypothetical protein [Micromonospora sp. WMMC241]
MSWVETATTVVGALGGAVGAAGGLAVLASRKKIRAEAADVLTDTALTLLEPLKVRVHELEAEVKTTRDNMVELSDSVSGLTATLRRWRAAILHPDAKVEALRKMVTGEPVGAGREQG